MLSPAQVAQRLGVGLPYVYTLLHSGKLSGERVDGRWRIDEAEVEKWRQRTEKRHKADPTPTEAVATVGRERDSFSCQD